MRVHFTLQENHLKLQNSYLLLPVYKTNSLSPWYVGRLIIRSDLSDYYINIDDSN